MATVNFMSEIEDDQGDTTEVSIEAEVTTWRDEGTYSDGPLMASLEDMTVYYMDGRQVPSSITAPYFGRWSNEACERASRG